MTLCIVITLLAKKRKHYMIPLNENNENNDKIIKIKKGKIKMGIT